MVAVSLKKYFFQAEDGIRDDSESRGLGDVYKRQLISYVKARSKNLDSHYIYFDRGTEGLDSAYENAQNQIDLIFESERLDYKSLVFEGEGHYERFWARRFKSFFLDLYSP